MTNQSSVSDIEIFPIQAKEGLIGFASLILDKKIKLNSIGIYTRLSGGYRITFPKKKEFNIFNPINQELSSAIEIAIIQKATKIWGGNNLE